MEKTTPRITIAVDGYSSSGKSTMAKQLAKSIGYTYIDSGAMYRAVALYALRNGMVNPEGDIDISALVAALDNIRLSFVLNPATSHSDILLNGEDVESEIRKMDVSNIVSKVAAIGEVRRALVREQQAMGREKGIVMDGRDIGTVVFPDAEMKVFVNASAETRARRRYNELMGKGVEVSYEDVLENVTKRDYIDRTRAESPLRQAPDAHPLDNSNMTLEQQNEFLLELFKAIIESKK